MPAAPSPTNWIAALGTEQSEAARRGGLAADDERGRRRRAPNKASDRARARARRRRGGEDGPGRPADLKRQISARRAGRRLLGQGPCDSSRPLCRTRPRTARRRARRCRSGRLQNEQVVSRRPSPKSPTTSPKRAANSATGRWTTLARTRRSTRRAAEDVACASSVLLLRAGRAGRNPVRSVLGWRGLSAPTLRVLCTMAWSSLSLGHGRGQALTV